MHFTSTMAARICKIPWSIALAVSSDARLTLATCPSRRFVDLSGNEVSEISSGAFNGFGDWQLYVSVIECALLLARR